MGVPSTVTLYNAIVPLTAVVTPGSVTVNSDSDYIFNPTNVATDKISGTYGTVEARHR